MTDAVSGSKGIPKSAAAWCAKAAELAAWAWVRLVNRTDVWGGYNRVEDREKVIRRPGGSEYKLGPTLTRPPRRARGSVLLTPAVLERHFRAAGPLDVAGLHTTGPDNTCKWGTVEVDWHGPDSTDPETNFKASRAWHDKLRGRGFRPLLTDSNDAGGFHLDILLREAIDSARMFWFLRDLVSDHAAYGLPNRPETFPKQPCLKKREDGRPSYGNWVRVPGRHHTRAHWSRVWDGSRWLVGAEAVGFILSLKGDAPDLIPEDMAIRIRVQAYLRKLPSLGEGQGRDDVAYNFLAFLARDLALADAEALRWAGEWDAGNRPPKGPDRLREILKNVHEYGQRAYGCGQNGSGSNGAGPAQSPPPTDPAPSAADATAADMRKVLSDHLHNTYRPLHRRGQAVYSDALSGVVDLREAGMGPPSTLLKQLLAAPDCPRSRGHQPSTPGVLRVWRQYLAVAWADVLAGLPDEPECDEVAGGAAEEWRRHVSAVLLRIVSMGRLRPQDGGGDATVIEQHSLLHWALIWANHEQRWARVRGYWLWCRLDGTEPLPAKTDPERDLARRQRLRVALRVELFGQMQARHLTDLPQRRLADLLELYGIGKRTTAGHAGQAAIELSREFLAGLLAEPEEPT